ncbi:membrane-bound lytic murein transglycosylase D [Hydrogenivirga caldilitoris]|uniref:Membrane-bound lytic murein transglycosylase D n=1 Tax=Hydrogenivirga caldilitoris TaxID=246264 RepID=A0A497XQ38_9AQUI|nr:transglycosylase SLT domain-containing protein [Hydrogenivirga caldilitoris]RLJ71075.1 membrane-bound lytic murein transglycosylase D [Hydrogenivirga caldilitoris]
MKKLLLLVGTFFLAGCTPTVKEVALYKGKKDIVIVKEGKFLFAEEEDRFINQEAQKLGINFPNRKEVQEHLIYFLRDKRSLEIALKRANLYIPYIKPILEEYGLPEELALLPFIESGFNPFALSRSGAGGIWQLMPFTAKRYGLRVDGKVDERFDLVKSTRAAAQYLKDLHELFGNWELVLAAYNCGEGCVSRRTKGVDFWRSKWALPEQTRKYVPMFFAALLIAKSPHKYGINVDLDSLNIQKKVVDKPEKVRSFVEKLSIKESTFKDLNPHIKGSYIPAGTYVYLPEKVDIKLASAPLITDVPQRVFSKPLPESRRTETKPPERVKEESKETKPRPVKVAKVITPKPVVEVKTKPTLKGKVNRAKKGKTHKKPPERGSERIVIKGVGEDFNVKTKMITLSNGAVLYIKE